MKDAISLIIDDERTRMQKHFLLLNLKELYASFKESNLKYDFGFSTFAKLKPLKIAYLLELLEHIPFVFAQSTKISS